MLPAVTRLTTAAVTAFALAAAAATPASAWGKKEQNFLAGVATAVVIGQIIKQNRKAHAAPAPIPVQPKPAPHPGQAQHFNAAAHAFHEYSPQARRAIQQRLAAYGYYRGPIDGVWGRGTAAAVSAYARDVNAGNALSSRDGTVRLLNQLIA